VVIGIAFTRESNIKKREHKNTRDSKRRLKRCEQ